MTIKLPSAMLEEMTLVNRFIPDKAPLLLFSSKEMLIFLLVVAILCSISGYLIDVRTGKSMKSQLAVQPRSAILLLTPTLSLDPATVNWHTYTDTTYGFSFKHPTYWSFGFISTQNNSQMYSDNYFVQFTVNNTRNPNRSPLSMGVEIHTNVHNWTLSQWLTNATVGHDAGILPQQQFSIGGYQAIKTRIEPSLENILTIAPLPYTSMTNELYDIMLYGSTGEGTARPYPDTDPFVQQELANFQLVLSSFRFGM